MIGSSYAALLRGHGSRLVVIAKDTLKNKVERLLKSPALTAPLKMHGLTIVETSAPKQTETTQRWKVGLQRAGDELPVRTKVEFSRRDDSEGTKFEAADREVLRSYGLTPVLATHYTTATATRQKIHALAARVAPQARDGNAHGFDRTRVQSTDWLRDAKR